MTRLRQGARRLAWLMLGERPTRAALLRLLLALLGVTLVLQRPGQAWPLPSGLADWLALMGGLCFALTNVLLRRWRDTPGDARALAMFGGGFVMAGALALGTGAWQTLPTAPVGDWLAWPNMGAYTICAASQFNGFRISQVKYTVDARGDAGVADAVGALLA